MRRAPAGPESAAGSQEEQAGEQDQHRRRRIDRRHRVGLRRAPERVLSTEEIPYSILPDGHDPLNRASS